MIETQSIEGDDQTLLIGTKNASKECRIYEVSIGEDNLLDGKFLMGGKRIDPHEFERYPDGPTSNVWKVAKDHFEGLGYEVF